MATYKAMQITSPGKLELVERATPEPGAGEVLLSIEACGICGADAGAIEGLEQNTTYPRVPGHEVVGKIVSLGAGVPSYLSPGQRVGVGRLGGHCNECEQCRRGHFNLCSNQPVVGSSQDGGYAEMMVTRATGLVIIPDELTSEDAAPLLCAGIATFNALIKSGARPGDTVAIQGIGGLGHLALQYAKKMGFRVVAIGRGDDIASDVKDLGAHIYLDTRKVNAVEELKKIGRAQVILTTITDSAAASELVKALAPKGKFMVVGAGKDPLTIAPGQMVGNELSIEGAITGTPFEVEKTLDFSLLTDVRARVETMPLAKAYEAYQRVMSGDVKFRMVLTMQ
ncbi:alcohol dehydrogenase [Klebsiella quasipneumoniae]|uniref:alcohol dehydrogenase n=1 Tax=Klebsiella quasipneumoniae TaxID=1463165 RepID=UPI0021BE0CF3|nr:alcohol dehydrogenase [Klebsiella quasipneumoniae]MCT8891693.1 alcohol dehydrogenase [Klebsiella quasipneumoniae subsp. similipneumoniae]